MSEAMDRSWKALAAQVVKRLDCRRCLRDGPERAFYMVNGAMLAYCIHRQLLAIEFYHGDRHLRPETSPATLLQLVSMIGLVNHIESRRRA
jgi:hypothetical protein